MPVGGRDLAEYERTFQFDRHQLQGQSILDLGSGPTAKFARELAAAGVKATVISLSPDWLFEGHRKNLREAYDGRSVAAIGQALPFRSHVFDKIFALFVQDHFTSNEQYINFASEIARTLRPGGEAMIGPGIDWGLPALVAHDRSLADKLLQEGVVATRECIPDDAMKPWRTHDDNGIVCHIQPANNVMRKPFASSA